MLETPSTNSTAMVLIRFASVAALIVAQGLMPLAGAVHTHDGGEPGVAPRPRSVHAHGITLPHHHVPGAPHSAAHPSPQLAGGRAHGGGASVAPGGRAGEDGAAAAAVVDAGRAGVDAGRGVGAGRGGTSAALTSAAPMADVLSADGAVPDSASIAGAQIAAVLEVMHDLEGARVGGSTGARGDGDALRRGGAAAPDQAMPPSRAAPAALAAQAVSAARHPARHTGPISRGPGLRGPPPSA